MRRRHALAIIALSLASAGAYAIAWLVETRREMNQLGARIPSPWLLAVPITALYWAWCWSEGVRHVTAARTTTGAAFCLWLLGPVGFAVIQARFNALTRWRRR